MTTEPRATIGPWLLLAALVGACGGVSAPRDSPLVAEIAERRPDLRENCELAAVKCTRCHTIDRVLRARVSSPAHWERYVYRMRMMPGAGISAADEPRIVECLVARSFGDGALRDGETAP